MHMSQWFLAGVPLEGVSALGDVACLAKRFVGVCCGIAALLSSPLRPARCSCCLGFSGFAVLLLFPHAYYLVGLVVLVQNPAAQLLWGNTRAVCGALQTFVALVMSLARGPWDHTVHGPSPMVPWFNVVISADTWAYGFVLFGDCKAPRMQ
jgi:hypothetical protein